jgi:hypothetical protein
MLLSTQGTCLFQALSQVFSDIKLCVRHKTNTIFSDQINAKLETFHDDLVTNIGKQVIQNLRELPKQGYTCDSLRLGFWAKGKRSSLISKRKLETPKSISHLIHELNDNAKHTCTEGRQGDCPNFQKLLGEKLRRQMREATKWVSNIERTEMRTS